MTRFVALPAVLLAAFSVVLLGLAILDRDPFWPRASITLSEAAAANDAAEVVRLLAQGHDPNGRYAVKAGYLGGRPLVVTPLEAAERADNPQIEAILVRAGATQTTAPADGHR